MKLGTSSPLQHDTPEEWAEKQVKLGCAAVVFPVQSSEPETKIIAYRDVAEKAGLSLAEVGIWKNALVADPEERRANMDYCVEQLRMADFLGARCAVNVAGRLAEGSPLTEDLKKTGGSVFVSLEGLKEDYMPGFMDAFHSVYDGIAPVTSEVENVGIQRYDNNGRTYIHLLNYRYDEQEDCIRTIPELHLTVRDVIDDSPTVITPEGIAVPEIESRKEDGQLHVVLKNVGLYAVVMTPGDGGSGS